VTENNPSRTASVVAASLVYLRGDSRVGDLISDDTVRYCRQFLRSAGCERLLRLAEHPRLRGAVRLLERVTLPGIMLHYAVRKRFLRDCARADRLPRRLPLRADQLPPPRLQLIGRAVRPSAVEVAGNPRARSAIMRVAEKTGA